ncbi:MAG: PIN domain-containing protein [Sciscionella sp.]
MSPCVLDTSAVLAWLREEPGADVVDCLLEEAIMGAANWSELAQKLLQHGADAHQTTARLATLGLTVEAFTAADALRAAELWPATRRAGLSLGDRACLALATRLELLAVIADQAWSTLELPATVQTIR